MNGSGITSRIILLFLGTFLGFMIAELLLWVLDKPRFYKMHSNAPQFAFIEGTDLWVNVPSERIRFVYDGNPRGYFGKNNEIDHHTNSLGFRGNEFIVHKPHRTFRIAFLGDSFTFGEGVRFADTYPEQVSLLLRQQYKSSHVNFESFNFGVGGHNTSQTSYVFRNIAARFNPDLVVLGYTLNDAEPSLIEREMSSGRMVRHPREHSVPEGLGDKLPPNTLLYRLRTSRLLWQFAENNRRTQKTISHYKSLFQNTDSDWMKSRRALQEIIDLCLEKNVPCYVLSFPVLYELSDRYPFANIHSLVRQEVEGSGGTFVDLFHALKGLESKALWVHPTDQHPNEEVHRIAARVLVERIADNAEIVKKISILTKTPLTPPNKGP